MAIFGDNPMDDDGSQVIVGKAVKKAGSRGNVVEINGQTYQPTGDLQNRGFASLTKNNPDLQSAIAAKGGKHSHQGDPGIDSSRQQKYHEQDRQLDQQIKQAGGQPSSSSDGDDDQDDNTMNQRGSKARKSQAVDEVIQRKNVDRATAQRIVARASR